MYRDVNDLKERVIRPALVKLENLIPKIRYTDNVADLLAMIAAHESHLGKYRRQVGGGPARGIYQIELPTHYDLFDNYLAYRADALGVFRELFGRDYDPETLLEHNDEYATVVARFLLWRKPEALPAAQWGDSRTRYLEALAQYAKTHWNTEGGAATPAKYLNDYLRFT